MGAGALATIGLVSPAFAAPVQPATDQVAGASCEVSAATLNWGVKESFRSYISGSIANGEWTVSDDMRYETPEFIWDQASGSIDSNVESGEISFTGAVNFTGHDGAMELDLADPSIEITDAETAYLILAISATDEASTGGTAEAARVRAAKLDLTDVVDAGGAAFGITGAVPRLTAEGAAALNGEYGSYVAGEELDAITLTSTLAGCELGEQAAVAPTTPAAPEQEQPVAVPAEPAQEIPWLPIGIGGVALLVIGVTGGMLVAGRGKGNTATNDEAAAE
nr:HtaA domain-containing protein [Leucobacter exalbidus]